MIQDDTGSRGKASTEDGSKPIWPILPIFGGVKLTSRNVNPGCVLMCEITEGTPWSRDPRWLGTSPSTIWIWIWPSWAAKSPGPCRRCRGCEHGHGGRWGHGKLQKGMMKTGGMVIARKVGCQYDHGMSWINSRSGTVWGNDLGLFQQNGKAQPAQRLSTERISGWQNIPIHRANPCGVQTGNQNLFRWQQLSRKITPSQDPEQLITGLNLYLAQLPDAGDGGILPWFPCLAMDSVVDQEPIDVEDGSF